MIKSGDIYFEMPGLTPLTMICWSDAEVLNGSNRWFKASSIYGTGYTKQGRQCVAGSRDAAARWQV